MLPLPTRSSIPTQFVSRQVTPDLPGQPSSFIGRLFPNPKLPAAFQSLAGFSKRRLCGWLEVPP